MMEIEKMDRHYSADYLSGIKLMVFDMDGVLLKNRNSWDVAINRALGMKVNSNSMKFTFEYLHKNRVPDHMYKKLDDIRMKTYLNLNDLTPNLKLTIDYLKERNIKTAIVSAGVHAFAEYLGEILEMDHYIGNKVDIKNKKFIMDVDPANKDVNVRHIQKKFNILPEETVSVGDSYFDLSMKRSSKYFVAFNPSSKNMIDESDFTVYNNDLYKIIEQMVSVKYFNI